MNILVIKHGALGDIVLAFPAFAAIRAAHPGAAITLLTTAPFAATLAASPWFERVEVDARPAAWNLPGLRRLRRQLRGYDLVYDLQTSSRSGHYFNLAGRPRWSGIAPGCALPHANPRRDILHTRERLAEQLAAAGIAALPTPNLAWLTARSPPSCPVSSTSCPAQPGIHALPAVPDPPYAILAPGAAPHRPEKRWPAPSFAALAAALPMPAVIIGTAADSPLAAIVRRAAPTAIDLTGHTTLSELAAVLAGAGVAIGNDTGPMHLAAALAIPTVVLFSNASDPARTAPRTPDGGWPVILRESHLPDLPVARVLAALP